MGFFRHLPLTGITIAFFLLTGCSQQPKPATSSATSATKPPSGWSPPPAGETVAQYSKLDPEDVLNKRHFIVKIKATEGSANGVYEVVLAYGHNQNITDISLPDWPGDIILKPLIQPGESDLTCVIGFDTGDGEFKPYYQASLNRGNIRLRQIVAYRQVRSEQ